MLFAVSESELEPPGIKAVFPPLDRVALPEPDPELTAMLSRAAKRVGLKWRSPPFPEASRLDDWFLEVCKFICFHRHSLHGFWIDHLHSACHGAPAGLLGQGP